MDPWVGKSSWRRKWQLTPVFLPEKFHGQTEETGVLQSMGSQRVGHNSETEWKCSIESIPRQKNLIILQTHDTHSLKGERGKYSSNTVKNDILTRHLKRKAKRNFMLTLHSG